MECQVFGQPMHYETYGEGIPLVMLHGAPSSGSVMAAFMEPMFATRAGWKRIYLDMPGMGQTPAHPNLQNIDGMLEAVLECIQQVIPGQHFALAGWSFGGYVARGVLYRRTELVDGLVLIVPGIFHDQRRTAPPPHVILVPNPTLTSTLDADERQFFDSVGVIQSSEAWEFCKVFRRDAALADEGFLSRMSGAFAVDPDALPEPFKRPSLFIMGKQDRITGYADSWQIYDNYPRGTFVVLDRAGHVAYIEQSHLVKALVHEWLDRVEESRRSGSE